MALTDKQKRFADEYLIDMNATQAYLRAGYNCSENTARINASRLLTNANVQEYIESKQKKIEEKTDITIEWLLNEMKDTYIKAKEVGEFSAANKSLEMLGKHKGMFKDKVEISGGLSIEKLLEEIS